MRKRQLTQEATAELLDVSVKSVWQWVAGERQPDLRRAVVIETHFGVGVRRWLE